MVVFTQVLARKGLIVFPEVPVMLPKVSGSVKSVTGGFGLVYSGVGGVIREVVLWWC